VIKPPASADGGGGDRAGDGADSVEGPLAGRTVDNQVSLVDLHPTMLEAAGAPAPDYELSESLYDFADREYHDYTFAEYAGFDGPVRRLQRKYPDFDASEYARSLQAVRDDEHKLIVTEDGDRELYTWRGDRYEREDLIDERPDVADELEGVLRDSLDSLDSPGTFRTPDDPGLEDQLEDLGYI
jgi:arylsulfatase A-like enzyme